MDVTPLALPLYPPDDHARWRDLPAGQREHFQRWLEDAGHGRPVILGVAWDDTTEQDGYWPVDYARWRVEELCQDPAGVRIGEVWTGLIITVRDIARALPEENLAGFARQHARRTGCANLLDVFAPTEEQINVSADYYLREFRAWRSGRP